jgi:hypothetical protein
MNFGDVLGCLIAVAILGFQAWTTFRVWKSDFFERDHKMNQTKLIWLLPLIGAVLVFSVLQQETERFRSDSHQGR